MQSATSTIYDVLGRRSIHPFPARMSPDIAIDIVDPADEPRIVLDPMAGSGTVLALARSRGHRAIGVDIDPLATLLADVWTRTIDADRVRETATQILDDAKNLSVGLKEATSYPQYADKETRSFIRFWFDETSRVQLTSLARCISSIGDRPLRDCLWVSFSRLIITKQAGASLAMDLSHSRPHKKYKKAPIKPFEAFEGAVERVVSNCISKKTRGRGPCARVLLGDARDLPLSNSSVDLVLTSPPYLNAIDYLRCSKFSLVWMGFSIGQLRTIRGESVGSERGLKLGDDPKITSIFSSLGISDDFPARQKTILARYIDDTRQLLAEVGRVLKRDGSAVFVLGENTIRGYLIRNSLIVKELAEDADLVLVSRNQRDLPSNRRYLPPPKISDGTDSLDSRMRQEVILRFKKKHH